jgi:hypothetical protein
MFKKLVSVLLLVVVAFVVLSSPVKADVTLIGITVPSIYWRPAVFGVPMDFYTPLMNADAIPFVYGLWSGKGLIGAQMNLINYGNFRLNFGGAGAEQNRLMPFAGFDYLFASTITTSGDTISYIGLGFAHDFDESNKNTAVLNGLINEILIKASFKFYAL